MRQKGARRAGKERGGYRRCSRALHLHQTILPVLGCASAQVGVAACRVISLDPARQRRRRRQSARHQDDATTSTFDLCDLDGDGGPQNAPQCGFDEKRPWRASRRRWSASAQPFGTGLARHRTCSTYLLAQLPSHGQPGELMGASLTVSCLARVRVS